MKFDMKDLNPGAKFYFDEIYLFITKRIIFALVSAPIAWFDRHVVDGGVNLAGWVTRRSGKALSDTQTSNVQTYGTWAIAGVAMVAVILIFTLNL